MSSSSRDPQSGSRGFCTTHWSIIVSARGDDSGAHESLGKLCQTYWYPLYAFVRRQGVSEHDAQDLTQEFFARLLEKDWLDGVDREHGRFRSWLLSSMKHFLANDWDRARAIKRGGGATVISLDALSAEERYASEPADEASAEKLFDRCWAYQLLDRVLARMRAEYDEAGKGKIFDELKAAIIGDAAPYSEIAARLGASESAAKAAAHRLRLRYRELLRAEIAETVALSGEIDDELAQLFTALGS